MSSLSISWTATCSSFTAPSMKPTMTSSSASGAPFSFGPAKHSIVPPAKAVMDQRYR
jgi:hypothetical protein